MSTFYFVRHGNKQENISNPQLTEIGHEQAQKTAEFLKQFPITQIIASPLSRTQQTAQHIAQTLSLLVKTDPRLQERMERQPNDVPQKEFFAEWLETTHNRDFSPRWGDSSRKTGERVEQIIQEIGQSSDKHVVLVTHGGTTIDFLRNVFDENHLIQLLKEFPEGQDYVVNECSVTQVKLENGAYTLIDLHHISHL